MANKQTKRTVRYVALEALERVTKGGAYSNLLLRELMNQGRLNEKDGRLLTELVYGTIARQLLLDYYLMPFTKQAKKWMDGSKIYCAYHFISSYILIKFQVMPF